MKKMYIVGKDIVDKFGNNTDMEIGRFLNLEEAMKVWEYAKWKYNDRIFIFNTETKQFFYSRKKIMENFSN